MARFAELVPSAGRYVNGADKAMLAADPEAEKADERSEDIGKPVALRLMRSTFQHRAQFGPRWVVDVRTLAGGEDIAIDFAAADKAGVANEARMGMFAGLRDRLDAGEAFDPVILARITPTGKKGGNPFWTFVDATPEIIADPVAPIWIDDVDDDEQPEDLQTPARRPRLVKAAQ